MQATDLFVSDPIPGIGGETWRRLWLAARDYSVADAYPDRDFPVFGVKEESATCVLCQQPLEGKATKRMSRFQAFVSGSLATSAGNAEAAVARAVESIPKLEMLRTPDWATRLEQIRKRNVVLADAVVAFKQSVEARRDITISALQGTEPTPAVPVLVSPEIALKELSKSLSREADALMKTDEEGQRAKMTTELAELTDRKIVATGRDRLVKRRDLLQLDALFAAALGEVQTKGITQKANELIDLHLTKVVMDQFDLERLALEITHLKVGLARKRGQTKATFQTNPGTTLTKLTSEILSEGEQRALALAVDQHGVPAPIGAVNR